MKRSLLVTLFLILSIGSFLGGAWYNRSRPAENHVSPNERRVLHYVDPMNPAHTSDKPGVAPCGMPLEPVYADEESEGIPAHSLSAGAVRITPQKQQLIGVQVDTVKTVSETHAVRALGRIAPDENRVYRLLAGGDGWISEVRESTTGSLVQKDQLMASFYSSDFLSKQQEYLSVIRSTSTVQQPAPQPREALKPEAQQPEAQKPEAQQPEAQKPEAKKPALLHPTAVQRPSPLQYGLKPQNRSVRYADLRGPQQEVLEQREAERFEAMQRETGRRAALNKEAETQGGEPPKTEPPKAEQPEVDPAKLAVPLDRRGSMASPRPPAYYTYRQEAAKIALMALGVGEKQLEEIMRTGQTAAFIEVRSPVTGFVLARNISPLQRVDRGAEFFKVADLSRVWVVADVFSNEAHYIHPGSVAKVYLLGQGKSFDATVSDVPGQFDPATRTLKVRLDADNPEIVLRPEMFVEVQFLIAFQPAITVPADALLDSGLKKTVFVDRGNGFFEPRTVKTGWRFDGRVEILEGLTEGERIVTSGNFLIDSDSRMKLAAAGLYGSPEKDPVCGMEVYTGKAKSAGLVSDFEGKNYYFCSAQCKAQFDKEHSGHKAEAPAETVQHGGSAAEKVDVQDAAMKDPVCGMDVKQEDAGSEGLVSEYEGVKYYFCSKQCKEKFDKTPQQYVKKADAAQKSHVHGEHEHD